MSSSNSDTENNSYESDDSDWNYIDFGALYRIEKSIEIEKCMNQKESNLHSLKWRHRLVTVTVKETVAIKVFRKCTVFHF